MSRIFAHRGLSSSCPENTLLAFRKALETGCDGIELDVQLTRDGELVIIHDETIDRTTDGKGKVRDFSFEELRRFDASGRFAGDQGFNPIPSLREYFDLVRDLPLITNIELKNSVFPYPGLEEKLIATVGDYGLEDRVLFSSFNHQSLMKCRELSPRCEIAFIISSWLISAGSYCRRNGGNYINPRFCFLTQDNMDELLEQGVRAMAWTVDDPTEMRRLAGMGVDSLITNEPLRAREALGH
ncbi:MAG TPA: glycerophosphodiester phosphodiesterase [Rectinemataceae bacterium]|nr:glycerophosphodiester phosphodiesterase [Rectinemataceae bacterium]